MKTEPVDEKDIVKLKAFIDPSRGNLFFGEAKKHVPIVIKRFYFITKSPNRKTVRGMHAHKTLEQVFFCISGSFELYLDDGKKKQKIVMNEPSTGVRVRKMVWHHMTEFSPDCVIFVVASNYHKESDYIRDYGEFLRRIKKG